MKMTPLKKQSKNEQRKYYSSKRGSWNGVSPITRIVQSRRVYDRNRIKREDRTSCRRMIREMLISDRKLAADCGVAPASEKADRLLRIINYGGYAPHRGYIDWGFCGRTLLHTGKYIKYPKNSNCQRWIKERNKPPDSQMQGCSCKRQLLPSALRLLVDTVLMR